METILVGNEIHHPNRLTQLEIFHGATCSYSETIEMGDKAFGI
jgi:hypothetical protein